MIGLLLPEGFRPRPRRRKRNARLHAESLEPRTLLDASMAADLEHAMAADLEHVHAWLSELDDHSQSRSTAEQQSSASASKAARASATITTVRPGSWSDPATWDGARVPTAEDFALVRHDVAIEGTAVVGRLDVDGAMLHIGDGAAVEAHGSIVLWEGAYLHGHRGRISFLVPDDRLFVGNTEPGPIDGHPDFHPDDIGLWALPGSHVMIDAPEVTPWVDAVPTAPVGDGTTVVAIANGQATLSRAPVGWEVGDTLLLGSERGHSKLVTLTGIAGTAIAYTEQSDGNPANFVGNSVYHQGVAYFHPKVANLSRRFTIDAPLVKDGDTHHRSHVALMHHSHAQLRYVGLRNLGARGKLGRYPIHFHHVHAHGDNSHEPNELTGAAIWQDVPTRKDGSHRGNRGIALHRSQGVLVQDNVVYRGHGHTVFMEDQEEFNNRILGNLVVDTGGKEELPVAQTVISYHRNPHSYWLRAGNEIRDNVSIGGGDGLVVLSQRDAQGNVVGVPDDQRFVYNFTSAGASDYGFWNTAHMRFVDSTAIFSGQAGYREGGNVNGTVLENPTLMYNARKQIGRFRQATHEFRVEGGLIVGTVGVSPYNNNTMRFVGTRFFVNSLIRMNNDPRAMLHFEGGEVHANQLTMGHVNRPAYLLARFEGVTGRLRDEVFTHDAPLDVDYVSSQYAPMYGLEGIEFPSERVRKLHQRAPMSGFVKFPRGGWTITPVGTNFAMGRPLSNPHEDTWRRNLAQYQGFGHGFAPGDYIVTRYNGESRLITVIAGEVVRWSEGTDIDDDGDDDEGGGGDGDH